MQTFKHYNFPFSVPSSKFRIPQVLYLPLLRKHRGCGGILPILECGDARTLRQYADRESSQCAGMEGVNEKLLV
jgi:hypothetical protein